jgi:4-alpha-glucanotransferase
MDRSSGILLHISSLPSDYGIGTFGKSAYDFADFLVDSGTAYWQVLPLGQTGYGNSPYEPFSSFAGNPYFIDLDLLVLDGLLTYNDINKFSFGKNKGKVSYPKLYNQRIEVLNLSYDNMGKFQKEFDLFKSSNSSWLKPYSLFMSLKEHFKMKPWYLWPDMGIRKYEDASVDEYGKLLANRMDRISFIQFLFYKQFSNLLDYLKKIHIKLIGDLPFYVSIDSCDVWSNQRYFMLDENCLPTLLSGVPRDAFSKKGQLWGTPIYNWDELKSSDYELWIQRINHLHKYFDMIRIDHFRGFNNYWTVPYGSKNAKYGTWNKGPGKDLIDAINDSFNKKIFIAENLGFEAKEANKLLDYSGYLGIKVMQFEEKLKKTEKNNTLYTSTHDTPTLLGWAKKNKISCSCDELIYSAGKTDATLLIVPMQDYLNLNNRSRMNIPGKKKNNWRWRLIPEDINGELSKRIYDMLIKTERI